MRDVSFGTHVLLAVVVELKNVFVQRDILVFFADDVPF